MVKSQQPLPAAAQDALEVKLAISSVNSEIYFWIN
jgi:hypothetical protein